MKAGEDRETPQVSRRIEEVTDLINAEDTCNDFVKLMDYIKQTKRSQRRDLHIRDNFVPLTAKQFKSS